MWFIRSLLLISLTVISSVSHSNIEYVTELQQAATEKLLWREPVWINLLHYDVDEINNDNYLSQVDDNRFFNAADGKTNTKSELLQTIAAFFRTDLKDNEHPQCRFVARLEWLKHQLSLDEKTLPAVDCKDYNEWYSLVRAEHITMVFPAYHLNSPSSMFGHTLLRMDKKFGQNESEWLSFAVNFGAETSADDNSIFYAFKGLAGGYPGHFIVTPYFKKIQEYNRIENRDIWEYSLNLTAEETDRIMTHLWELKEMNFDYFFFDENCSYRLLELLEVARPGIELTNDFGLTAIPVDTVRAVERSGLIDSIQYRPSQATALQHLLDAMPEDDHRLVAQLTTDFSNTQQHDFVSLPERRQQRIADAAYKYARYLQTGKQRDPELARTGYQLLEKLNTYPAKTEPPEYTQPVAPEKSHESRRISFGIGGRMGRAYGDFGYKMSFHDLEDNETGFLRGAQINIGNVEARIDNDSNIRLHRMDLIDIFSLTPRTQFLDPLSWRIYTGLERQPTSTKDRLVSHVTGGAGVSYELWQNSQVYGLGMLRLEHNSDMNNAIEPGIGLLTGLLHHFGSSTAHFELSGEQFKDDIYRVRSSYTHNFVLAVNHSIKLTAAREWHSVQRFTELNLSYQHYFY